MGANNPYKNGGMFEGALHTVFEKARQLRGQMTAAETVLWMHLRGGIDGCKFRRQHPIGQFIADFYCHKAKLVIEVDGSIHQTGEVKKNDEEKETYLANAGYAILRSTNEEVMHDIQRVLSTIVKATNSNIRKHSPHVGG